MIQLAPSKSADSARTRKITVGRSMALGAVIWAMPLRKETTAPSANTSIATTKLQK
jgi:hypothetical protein